LSVQPLYCGEVHRRSAVGSYAKGRARRDAIIDVASEKFREIGYYQTALSQIAKDVGLSEGGLSHHFPSKKHLLLAVAERRLERTSGRWETLTIDADGLEPFREMVASTERFVTEPGLIQLFILVMSEAAEPSSPAHALFSLRYAAAVAGLAGLLKKGVDAGKLREEIDCTAIAQECIAVSDGLQLQWIIADGRVDIVERIRAYTDRLVLQLRADSELLTSS
jgi:AcrR family transcriptional regulator